MSKNCDNCIHKEVCKFKEKATDKKVEEPFEISCKYYAYTNPTPTYPYGQNWGIRGLSLTSTSICDGCGFYDKLNKKCTIEGKPMGIVGLPCQTTITCNATAKGIE